MPVIHDIWDNYATCCPSYTEETHILQRYRLADSQKGPEQGMLAFDPVSYGRIARGHAASSPKGGTLVWVISVVFVTLWLGNLIAGPPFSGQAQNFKATRPTNLLFA